MKNNYTAKFIRTFTSVLPVSKSRMGACARCGKCCSLPNKCFFLGVQKDGNAYCTIHSVRPLNCRKYPRTGKELLTKDTCGFKFN